MRQAVIAARWNFLGFFKNPRMILAFLFAFILCFFLSDRAMYVAEYFDSPMQAAEPVLWTFGDATSVLLASLLLIFMFMDMPKLSPFTPYALLRMTKGKWLLGQFFYLCLGVMIYLGYVFAVTGILCMKKTYIGNIWSKTAALLAYSDLGKKMSVPSTVKVMESATPLEVCFQMLLLLFFYALTLCFLMLFVQLAAGRRAGIAAGLCYSLFGFLLKPETLAAFLHKEEYEMYRIRRITGWISPLNHATYGMHDFGYDFLPSIGQSCSLFICILALLAAASFFALKKYNFTSFTGDMG